jgi:hypothetical protein
MLFLCFVELQSCCCCFSLVKTRGSVKRETGKGETKRSQREEWKDGSKGLEKFDLVSSMVLRPLDVQLVIVRTCALNAPSSAATLLSS